MAYYVPPAENYQPQNLPFDQLTHIIYSFTEVIDNEMKFVNPQDGDRLQQLSAQKKQFPHIKVMIACGGWGGSGGFSDMAATAANRQTFVNSVMAFIDHYQLDGLDIDWEYPGLPGAGNPNKPEDKENFTALMKELREAMDDYNMPLTLTFASAGWEKYYDHVELQEVMKYADYMNVMTYDLIGGDSPYCAHHTNLGRIEMADLEETPAKAFIDSMDFDFTPRSTEAIIDFCLNKGVDPKQLVVGAAFYGKSWKGVNPDNHGLYQNNKGPWKGWPRYSEIRANYENKNGFMRYWDPVAKAPFLYNARDSVFITYEDTQSARLKTEYTLEKNLGGIMFWQLSLDTPEDGLLDAIYNAAIKEN
ncbi:glycoside hydrolase family 18 protein [Marinilabiliaceae bacterium JC017]|nr:glycoside hydrolase family 18 protein [Marinilabiliaceae bacterium JC017]